METTIFRNTENLGINEVIEVFKSSLAEKEEFEASDIEALAEQYAKNPVDKFIITEALTGANGAAQGDIMIIGEHTNLYKQHIATIKNLQKTDRLVLQEGDSMTGDHRLVPMEGSKYTIKTGRFTPAFLKGKSMWREPEYQAILFETDKPFLIFHREHGNVALPQGKYMFCSQLDPVTLDRMMD